MSHIFGLPHSLSDIPGFLGGIATGGMVNFSDLPTVPATTGVGTVAAPCPGKAYQIVTTVNPDGSTTSVTKAKTRRRKRRLATMSDIKDLAALKSILGGGKAFDTWIATRGR